MDRETREFHDDAASIYFLPNDLPEHARLDEQAKHMFNILGHRILHSPLPNPKDKEQETTILDVGCGTGYVSDTFSLQYPSATIYGLDISNVPYRPGRNANVHFLHGNILTQAPSNWKPSTDDTPSHLPDTHCFDLIFSRFLIGGISDWPAYTNIAFTLLKPSGWMEVHELDPIIYDGNDTSTVSEAYWHNTTVAASAAKGMDWLCARRMAGWMKQAGFVDIEVKDYAIPLGGEGEKTEELRAAGDFFAPTFTDIREFLIREQVEQSPEETERMVADMRRGMAPEPGKHCKLVVTCGRKP